MSCLFHCVPSRRTMLPVAATVVSLHLLLLTGCGKSGPQTIVVRGTVTSGGKPLEGGTIAFQPTKVLEGAPMRPAIGQIEPDGTYSLTTFTKGDGVQPGEYQVVVTSLVGAPPLTQWEESPPPRKSRIPAKYNQTTTSGLTASIAADADEPLTIDFKCD
jgi:hypothetical protein